MRSFLGWLVLVAVLGAVAFVLAPVLIRPLVVDGVRAASPFGTGPLDVDVSLDTPGLLRGSIDRVHVSGSNLDADGSTVGSLDATASNVSIVDRSFASIEGTLIGVTLRRDDGTSLDVERLELSGASGKVDGMATVGTAAAVALVRGALTDAGLPVESVELVDGGVRVVVLGQTTDVALGAVDGALTIAGSLAGGSIVLFGPEPGEPWRITGATASASGLQVQLVVDAGRLLTRS